MTNLTRLSATALALSLLACSKEQPAPVQSAMADTATPAPVAEAEPLNVDAACSAELASARAALNEANLDLSSNGNVHSLFPFDRILRNGCGVFPADFAAKDAGRSEKTSQCNRAILAKALVECVNWELPSLPKQMASDGFIVKVVEVEKYDALKNAATSKDWLGYLNLVYTSRRDPDSPSPPTLTEFPDYDTIVSLVEDAPKLTLLVGGSVNKYPELFRSSYASYRPCRGGSGLVPCDGSSDVADVSGEFKVVAVGRECASNSIGARSDGQGWVMRPYQFDACRYHLVPTLNSPFASNGDVRGFSFDEAVAEERTELLAKLSYRETTIGAVRTSLLKSYDTFLSKAGQFPVEDQARFFADLESARKYKAVPDTTPLPAECQGSAVDAAGPCSEFLGGPRYKPFAATAPQASPVKTGSEVSKGSGTGQP